MEKDDGGLKDNFSTGSFNLEQGFQRIIPDADNDSSDSCVPNQTQERTDWVASTDPKPVKGGFLPRLNIYQRY